MTVREPSATPAAAGVTDGQGLRAGSVGLGGVLMQSVAQISPTLGIFYTIAFNTGQAGVTAPLTYLAAFIVCLSLAVPLSGLARHLPSAGGFYTYISQGIGPRSGFITGWLYAVMVTIVPAALAAFTGAVLHDELDGKYGFPVPWWAYALVILGVCFACAYRGIVISARFMIIMSAFEIAVGLGLALSGLASPGPGGVNASGFNPGNIGGSSGFFLAIVLSIFAFTGFESAAAVGEESRDPRRIIPRAITGSLALIGAFYVVCAWGLQVGWGTANLGALANSPTAPAFVLAERLWHGGWIVVLIALVNSGLGVCIACTTSSTRTVYGMARTGVLPAPGAELPTARDTSAAQPADAAAASHGHPLGPSRPFRQNRQLARLCSGTPYGKMMAAGPVRRRLPGDVRPEVTKTRGLLEGHRNGQQPLLPEVRSNELHADRQAPWGEPGRHRNGRAASHADVVGGRKPVEVAP
jgi:Amino acid permease